MATKVKPVPKAPARGDAGTDDRSCGKAIEFYKRGLGAELLMLAPAPEATRSGTRLCASETQWFS